MAKHITNLIENGAYTDKLEVINYPLFSFSFKNLSSQLILAPFKLAKAKVYVNDVLVSYGFLDNKSGIIQFSYTGDVMSISIDSESVLIDFSNNVSFTDLITVKLMPFINNDSLAYTDIKEKLKMISNQYAYNLFPYLYENKFINMFNNYTFLDCALLICDNIINDSKNNLNIIPAEITNVYNSLYVYDNINSAYITVNPTLESTLDYNGNILKNNWKYIYKLAIQGLYNYGFDSIIPPTTSIYSKDMVLWILSTFDNNLATLHRFNTLKGFPTI